MKTTVHTRIATSAWTLLALLGLSALSSAETVGLYFDPATPQIAFAAGDIKAALEKDKHTVQTHNLAALAKAGSGKKIVLAVAKDKAAASMLSAQGGKPVAGLGPQAYALRTTTKPDLSYWVLGGDAVGAMYGGLQIAENVSVNGFSGSYDSEESPFMLNRGMKLNLPLDRRLPTYVGRWTSNSAKKAIPHVWDMSYWKTLIDQQARNRDNMLSVWVHHPFPALVKLPDYPKVSLPRIEGFDGFVKEMDHDQRVAFWREVMMAYLSAYYAHKVRGATYKKAGEIAKAREEMAKAYCWWMAYSRSMEDTYHADSFRNTSIAPNWEFADAAVLKEYTDLGGEGVPDCNTTQKGD